MSSLFTIHEVPSLSEQKSSFTSGSPSFSCLGDELTVLFSIKLIWSLHRIQLHYFVFQVFVTLSCQIVILLYLTFCSQLKFILASHDFWPKLFHFHIPHLYCKSFDLTSPFSKSNTTPWFTNLLTTSVTLASFFSTFNKHSVRKLINKI